MHSQKKRLTVSVLCWKLGRESGPEIPQGAHTGLGERGWQEQVASIRSEGGKGKNSKNEQWRRASGTAMGILKLL